jgi:hypothetical protein
LHLGKKKQMRGWKKVENLEPGRRGNVGTENEVD